MRLVALVAALIVLAVPGVRAETPERLPSLVHVHSSLSTGDLSLDELADRAERQGIAGLLLAENYLLRIEYGLPPFRALTRVTYDERSVLASGLTSYLARVAEARRNHPKVLIVPGVEVIPHYFWTGAPWTMRMTLHNVQKNLVVFGIEDAAALATLPVIGNRPAGHYTAQSLIDAAPALFIVPGIAFFFVKRRQRRRLQRAVVVVLRRRWVSGLVLLAIGMAAVVRGWPFAVDVYTAYEDRGMEPYQRFIDHVARLGGVTLWSFPEAPDLGTRSVGPVHVDWETEPYPDDLLRTFRYTSFGALYEQRTRVPDPGGAWDRLLREAAAGERSRPAWAIGESGFHGTAGGKRLTAVQTVFLADGRSEAALLDAYRHGRMYALIRGNDRGLVLEEFTVSAAGVTGGMGETVRAPAGARVEARVAISATDGSAQAVRVLLVKDGSLVEGWSGTTPFRATHVDVVDETPSVYRVDVRGPEPHRILTNPVFVKRP